MAQYIPKDALVAEIERRIEEITQTISLGNKKIQKSGGNRRAELIRFLSFLDTLEVKEVDLEKEVNIYGRHYPYVSFAPISELLSCAKYFFELGLSVSNPITAADRGIAEEIITNLKRVEQDYRVNLTKEIEWLRNKVKKGE